MSTDPGVQELGKRRVGNTALEVTRMGFGGAPIGNLYTALSDQNAEATIRTALDSGINYFDTAPLYGHGLSELRLGRVLRQLRRDDFILSTKVGRRLVATDPEHMDYGQFPQSRPYTPVFDYSYDGTLQSIDDSLQRLGIERIDIVLIHDIDVWTHKTREAADARFTEAMEGTYRALHRLRAEGAIAAFGAGVNEWQVCERLAKSGEFDCFLLAGRYTLLEQQALKSFLPLCVSNSISVIIGGPYNTGILATGATPGAHYNYEPAPEDILSRVRRIENVCRQHGVSLAAAALQFPLAHPAVAAVIPGARSQSEVHRNAAWIQESIPAAFWSDLKNRGLLPGDVPAAVDGPA